MPTQIALDTGSARSLNGELVTARQNIFGKVSRDRHCVFRNKCMFAAGGEGPRVSVPEARDSLSGLQPRHPLRRPLRPSLITSLDVK